MSDGKETSCTQRNFFVFVWWCCSERDFAVLSSLSAKWFVFIFLWGEYFIKIGYGCNVQWESLVLPSQISWIVLVVENDVSKIEALVRAAKYFARIQCMV